MTAHGLSPPVAPLNVPKVTRSSRTFVGSRRCAGSARRRCHVAYRWWPALTGPASFWNTHLLTTSVARMSRPNPGWSSRRSQLSMAAFAHQH